MTFTDMSNLPDNFYEEVTKAFTCNCCNKQHCIKSMEVITEEFRKKVDKCIKENWCPQCGKDDLETFWIRDEAIECGSCR